MFGKLLIIIATVMFVSCSTMPAKNMVEDTGSKEKVDLLRQRADEFWKASVNLDKEKIYSMYDPFFIARTNKYAFLATLGIIKYHMYEIKDVKVVGNVGTVRIKMVYSVPLYKFKQTELSKPETETEFDDKWLYVYDNWYKEYYSSIAESGFIYY